MSLPRRPLAIAAAAITTAAACAVAARTAWVRRKLRSGGGQ